MCEDTWPWWTVRGQAAALEEEMATSTGSLGLYSAEQKYKFKYWNNDKMQNTNTTNVYR